MLKLYGCYTDETGTVYEVVPTADAFITVANKGWRIDALFNRVDLGWSVEVVLQTKSGADSKAANRRHVLPLESYLRSYNSDVANLVDATIKEIS